MNASIISFVFATILTVRLPIVPTMAVISTLVFCAPIAVVAFARANTRIFGAFYFGTLAVILSAHLLLANDLPEELEQSDILVEGYVSSLPVRTVENASKKVTAKRIYSRTSTKFQFQVDTTDSHWRGGLVQLSYYGNSNVYPGQKLRLKVRLSRRRGLVNGGLFDYEAWLFSQRVVATGYVRSRDSLEHEGSNSLHVPHHQIRQALSRRIQFLAGDDPHLPLLLALSVGQSQGIPPAMWQVLSGTGTNHLLIISGLHVGLIAALSLKLFTYFLRGFKSHRLMAGLLSAMTTVSYGLIAGLGLPVQRALIMVLIVYLTMLLKRSPSVMTVCCSALFCVVLFDPFASLSAGFWLSFGAVFLLLFVFSMPREELDAGKEVNPSLRSSFSFGLGADFNWGVDPKRRARQILYSQWVVFAGMCPLMLVHVGQFSMVGFLANLFAIPFVSLLIVPLIFLSLPIMWVSDAMGRGLIELLLTLLSWLWGYLTYLDSLDMRFFTSAVPIVAGLFAVCGIVLVFSPKGLMPKWLAVFLFLPIVKAQLPVQVGQGELRMTLLDVGQGLSVVLMGANHTVVYDAGASYGDRFNVGEQIVTPFLRRMGVRRIDRLILSHNDNDHVGGAQAIRHNFLVSKVMRGEPVDASDLPCDVANEWRLDGVRYSVLKRTAGKPFKNKNDRSCVLLVETKHYSMLLPGDIGSGAEERLMISRDMGIDLLVSPHHGSATSSGPGFLNHVEPQLVLISAGYRNKFGHPHNDVMNRYRARDIISFNTAETGAITVSTGTVPHVSYSRAEPAGIWRPVRLLKTEN
jgi:competence protein ComEC